MNECLLGNVGPRSTHGDAGDDRFPHAMKTSTLIPFSNICGPHQAMISISFALTPAHVLIPTRARVIFEVEICTTKFRIHHQLPHYPYCFSHTSEGDKTIIIMAAPNFDHKAIFHLLSKFFWQLRQCRLVNFIDQEQSRIVSFEDIMLKLCILKVGRLQDLPDTGVLSIKDTRGARSCGP